MENNRIIDLFTDTGYNTEQAYIDNQDGFRNRIHYNDPANIYAIGRDTDDPALLNGIIGTDDNLNSLTGKLAEEIDHFLDLDDLEVNRMRADKQAQFTTQMIQNAQEIRVFAEENIMQHLNKGALANEINRIVYSGNFNNNDNELIFVRNLQG
jgi:hypothetical protein